jgi:5-methyltetrahydrofolate--homocysteine methyltransferase
MIVIGEKINATRKSIAEALQNRDADTIVETAKAQADAGADFLDVNGGDPHAGKEAENIAWLIDLVQSNTDVPVAVDTADPEAARKGLELAEKKPILNSISLESERLEPLLPVASERECLVIALLMSDDGPPKEVDDRVANAERLIGKLTDAGKQLDEILVDPCVFPAASDPDSVRKCLDGVAAIRAKWPEVHISLGVSNVSHGLPKRHHVNLALLAQAIFAGADAGIVDPTAPGTMATIYAAEALAGRDEFCMNYVTAAREGKLG